MLLAASNAGAQSNAPDGGNRGVKRGRPGEDAEAQAAAAKRQRGDGPRQGPARVIPRQNEDEGNGLVDADSAAKEAANEAASDDDDEL